MEFIRRLAELGRDDVELAGGKGANLGELTRAGLPVPPGFVVTTDAYRAFVGATGIDQQLRALAAPAPGVEAGDGEELSARIRTLFGSAPVPEAIAREVLAARGALGEAPVAVRSSATAEDLVGASFAGQQDSYLNVRGAAALLAAIRDCWASLWTARAMAYRARQDVDPAGLALAVVVQQLVDADAAGVMFTADPTDGRRDRTVISAAWGLGESVVGGSVTTDDVVVEKATGRVRSRTTADKAVMTVTADGAGSGSGLGSAPRTGSGSGGTVELEVPADRRTRPVLDDAEVAALAALGARIEELFGVPQDVEWARAGDAFWIVQSRPITALPEPAAAPPTDWPVPDPRALYFRASIVEQLPDPLTPLFAELAAAAVPRSLLALMRDLLGPGTLRADDLGFPTVNGYAYYQYSRAAFVRLTLAIPRAVRLLNSPDVRFGVRGWREHARPRYVAVVAPWVDRPLGGLTVAELLAGVVELLDAGTEYYTAVQSVIPVAASSEALLDAFYRVLVRRPGDPPAATFLLGYDSMPIRAEKSLYDLSVHVRRDEALTAALVSSSSARVADMLAGTQPPPSDVDEATWRDWATRFRDHLDRYGHSVYNLDVVHPVPADRPAPLLDTLRFYLEGGGTDPHERQRASAARREDLTTAVLSRLDPVRRTAFTALLRWAQASAPVREDALADVGLAWPHLRRILLEVGRRLVEAGVIDRADDVFWLHRDEILADRPVSLGDLVAERKALWRGRRRVTPPQVLPHGSWMEAFERLMPAASADQSGHVLTGIGASSGQVTAPGRVLGGPEEFGRMRPGDVLVASITTPAWTSLFAMASGVVTDVGGPLSHSSIVAREYGIPAVLGTGVATRRIPDGARIRVDGDAGTVTLVDAADDPARAAPDSGTTSGRRAGRTRGAVGAAVLAGAAALALARRRRRRAGASGGQSASAEPARPRRRWARW